MFCFSERIAGTAGTTNPYGMQGRSVGLSIDFVLWVHVLSVSYVIPKGFTRQSERSGSGTVRSALRSAFSEARCEARGAGMREPVSSQKKGGEV